ncbi:MAG: zf-TFIIB domain-containing protein [Phycisphaera sp. RhM]|nr:zf-TFIIB domain-containing protein [Phycisphaera sp. RhM]
MKCPRDGATLASETYEADVVVDRCPMCRGLWLDSGELKTIQETIEHDYSQQLQRINVSLEPMNWHDKSLSRTFGVRSVGANCIRANTLTVHRS